MQSKIYLHPAVSLFARSPVAGIPRLPVLEICRTPTSSSQARCAATIPSARYWRDDEPLLDYNEKPGHGRTGSSDSQRGMKVEKGRYFTKSHEWFEVDAEGEGVVGITQVAQRALGEIMFVRTPREGERFKVMDTLVTLEGIKTFGEVKSPVSGEVLEVNPRLEKEPGLLTHFPLQEGWLVRMSFKYLPSYLKRSRTISRMEIEPFLADPQGLQEFLSTRLEEEKNAGDVASKKSRQLVFDSLRPIERSRIHAAAEQLQLSAESRGRGPYRQLMVSRQSLSAKADEEEEQELLEPGSPP